MLNRKNSRKGFTLIEVIIVMAIIGILVLLGAPRFMDYVTKSKVTQIQADMKTIESVVMADMADATANDKEPSFFKEDADFEDVKELIDKGLEDIDTAEVKELNSKDVEDHSGTKLKGADGYKFYADEEGVVYLKKEGKVKDLLNKLEKINGETSSEDGE